MKRPAVDYPFHSETGCNLGRIHWSGPYVRTPGRELSPSQDLRFVYVTRGVCIFKYGRGQSRRLTAGDMMIVVPPNPYGYKAPPGEEWDEQYIACDGMLPQIWQKQGLVSLEDPVWRLLPVTYWVNRMIDVIGDIAAPDAEESLAQLGRLQILLADMRQARHAGASFLEDQLWLKQARRLLDANESDPHPSLESAATALNCSYHTFRRRFTRLTGITPARYRLQSQVYLCRALITRNPELAGKEIAARCGFSDEFYFSRQFRQVFGIAPSAYRREVLGWRQAEIP